MSRPDRQTLTDYYRRRAREYDAFYTDPQRQDDLAALGAWIADETRGRHVLELAAGTGYWTAIAASGAASVTATDINAETLAIASARVAGPHVALVQGDAWDLPALPGPFDLGMAHLWWSHLPVQERGAFLRRFAGYLAPGATLLMIDETLVPGVGGPIVRRDADGNTWQRRWLDSGERFDVVKNYPDAGDLRRTVGTVCADVEILQLRHFWALKGRFAHITRR